MVLGYLVWVVSGRVGLHVVAYWAEPLCGLLCYIKNEGDVNNTRATRLVSNNNLALVSYMSNA